MAIFLTKHSLSINSRTKYVKKRSYKNFDIHSFLTDIHQSNLIEKVMCHSNIESAALEFQTLFTNILDRHAPVKIFQSRKNYLPFLSQSTKELISKKNKLFKEATKGGCKIKLEESKSLSKEIKKGIKADRKRYFNDDINVKLDPASAWKRANQYLGIQKCLSPTEITITNNIGLIQTISVPLLMADKFITYLEQKLRIYRKRLIKSH